MLLITQKEREKLAKAGVAVVIGTIVGETDSRYTVEWDEPGAERFIVATAVWAELYHEFRDKVMATAYAVDYTACLNGEQIASYGVRTGSYYSNRDRPFANLRRKSALRRASRALGA